MWDISKIVESSLGIRGKVSLKYSQVSLDTRSKSQGSPRMAADAPTLFTLTDSLLSFVFRDKISAISLG